LAIETRSVLAAALAEPLPIRPVAGNTAAALTAAAP